MADNEKATPPPPAPTAPAAAAPAKPVLRDVRITVNGPDEKVVNGKTFTIEPTVYKRDALGWNDKQWAVAKQDPNLVIEEVDANGKVFVPRRNRDGKVVRAGQENVPPVKEKKKAAKKDDEDDE